MGTLESAAAPSNGVVAPGSTPSKRSQADTVDLITPEKGSSQSPSKKLRTQETELADTVETPGSNSKDARDGWVVMMDTLLTGLTAAQLGWLTTHAASGELCTEVYTGGKTYARRGGRIEGWSYERAKPAPLSFGLKPEVEADWSNVTRGFQLHVPGLEPSQSNFNFQRVRVLPVDGSLLLGEEVRMVVEWHPVRALEHMASKLRFHAAELSLSCNVAAMQPRGWKAATSEEWFRDPEELEFFLRGCANEPAARQPPRFRRFPLRPEQLRSLHWMIEREARPASFSSELSSRYIPGAEWDSQPEHWADLAARKEADYWQAYETRSGFPWCYEATLKATFSSAGGVLGDAIGSGKTATLIGLLDSQRSKATISSEAAPEARRLIPTTATLILVPANLLGQWEGEFKKFLGPEAFKFLVIRTVGDLKKVTADELTQCEIVLTTYKLLYSSGYVERLKSLSCTRTNRHHERIFLGAPIEKTLAELEKATESVVSSSAGKVGWTLRLKDGNEVAAAREAEQQSTEADSHAKPLSAAEVNERIETLGLCKDWRKLPHPVFELFFWHRIVFDEFHELEAMDKRRRCMLENMRCQCRWGLTGTPPKRDVAQITELARMLRVRVEDDDHVQCQHFLDTFVRQNFAELPEIPVKEHIVIVKQTLEERALYLQRAYEGNRRNLLQFCSHHCLRGREEEAEEEEWEEDEECNVPGRGMGRTARVSVEHLEKDKKEKQAKQKMVVTREYKILAAISSGQGQGYKNGKAESDAAAKLAEVEDKVRALRCPALDALLSNLPTAEAGPPLVRSALEHCNSNGSHAGASTMEVLRALAREGVPTLPQLRSARAAQLGRCSAALTKLVSVTRSLHFLEASLSVLRGTDGSDQAPECTICLESMSPNTAALLPCAHAFCMSCIGAFGPGLHACPTCRSPFSPGQAALVSSNVSSSNLAPPPDVERFGSKLASIGETLKDIHKRDPKAKAIVFVQWRELEKLVGESLRGMGIEYAQLAGSTVTRSRLIAEFQENDKPRVLLQSLENSASGANLTRASYVLLVHPMDASTRERAVAYEMQALGRVRRCGQTAKQVHLYRFVTKGTVEEEITKEHQVGVTAGIRDSNGGQSAASAHGGATSRP